MRINSLRARFVLNKLNNLIRPPTPHPLPTLTLSPTVATNSLLRYSSIDLAYFFQDLRSEALKAISWPSRCGAIVIPASGDAETVNCAETQVDATDRRTDGRASGQTGGEQAVEWVV